MMTAIRRAPLGLVLAAAVLLVALPSLNAHAVQRHGRTARSAWRYVSRCDPDDDRLWCGTQDDGRIVRILRLPKLAGCPVTWAIVIAGAGYLVTAFLSQSRRQVERMKGRCER